VLGGWLIEHASWRWVFFINLPLATIVLLLTFWRVPESRNPRAARPDWPGAALAAMAIGAMVYALIESSKRSWSDPTVIAALLIGIAALAAFLAVEIRSRTPLLPLGLFRSRDFTGANVLTLFLYSALGGMFFFFPMNLIQAHHYTATAAGAASLPFILLMFSLSRWSGKLVDRYGAKRPLVVGPTIAAVGFALFAVPSVDGSYWTTFFPAVVVLGFGMATSVAPLTTTVMNSIGQEHAGIASGINNAVSRLAGVLAIAVFGIVMLGAFNTQLDSRLSTLDLTPQVRQSLDDQRMKLAAMEIPREANSATQEKIRRSIEESFVAGFRRVMLLASGLALASAVTAWGIIGGTRGSDEVTAGVE
jgi:MFS family permease